MDKCPPVLFLIFNRPEMSGKVLERIRAAQPEQFFVASDGPRAAVSDETERCERTRKMVLEGIDWPCTVHTLFRKQNLGCKKAVSSAIDWFFEQVEEGIILEDDCRPDLTFFQYAAELLGKYRDNRNVMMISGNCHLPAAKLPETSYYFSNFAYIWGWATWKSAWKKMDVTLSGWDPATGVQELPDALSPAQKKYWANTFSINAQNGSSWAIVWQYCCWRAGGITINPSINLVSHIDSEGTHMKPYDPLSGAASHPIGFPLRHPASLDVDTRSDRITESRVRRSTAANLYLILRYLLRLPFNRETTIPAGLCALTTSLSAEIKHRRSLHRR